jgi:tRNA-dihydrouridine synthase 3
MPRMDLAGRVLLAPLTKGGNLPFRRLCTAFGAEITMGEMAYAYQVVRKRPTELALLRKHPDERCFGVQLAAAKADVAIAAGLVAVERGAAFVDLNCGCPIHDVVRRGMGAVLLQRPQHLQRLVQEMVQALPVPVTVKIRLGWKEDDVNASEIAELVEAAGAAAVTLHGRTREQRYTRAADWEWVRRLTQERRVPIVGNGDILTWYEAHDWWQQAGCAAIMVGRGALVKPWIFQEIAERREIEPDAEARTGIYFQFARYLKEHFRDDEKGKKRAMFFLPWHFSFFCRYRPLPEALWHARSREHPLMQTRMPDDADLPLLEQLLRDPREDVHARLADELWAAADEGDAVARFLRVAAEMPPVAGEAGEVATAHG